MSNNRRTLTRLQATVSAQKMTSATSKTPRFRKIQSFQLDYSPVVISHYESERSGMQVVVADRKGPKVNGYFALATEASDDSGAPHTLEHLVFMGSKSYSRKGLLDKLAGRAYSSTNAWTAVDHTAYTLDSAGWDGFAQILPIYLEHVLLPTMTDDACTTEVHHIDGEGRDAGVVYSEMQGIQNSPNEVMSRRAHELMYTENVGFRYETGGMMEALRVLPREKILQFHRDMYQPRNLAVIVIGEADGENLLQILDEFEDSIEDEVPFSGPFKRPFLDSPQPAPLRHTVVDTVEFPEEDESMGEVCVSFFGPDCNDQPQSMAMEVLLGYLVGSSASPLENQLVEKEELASQVLQWVDKRPNSVVWLVLAGVATEKLAVVEQRLFFILREISSKPLDMDYMHNCIRRYRLRTKSCAESSEQFYANSLVLNQVFGDRDGSNLAEFKSLAPLDGLEGWDEFKWRLFLKRWIADAHHVSILGKPSTRLATELREQDEARIRARKAELGEKGLAQLARRLEEAKAHNDTPFPPQLLDRWPMPSTKSIRLIESETARCGKARKLGVLRNAAQDVIDAAPQGRFALFIQFENVATSFVSVTLHFGAAGMPIKYKPLLEIFNDNFFSTPVMRDGRRLEFEDVIKQLQKETVKFGIAGCGDLRDLQGMSIEVEGEPDKYGAVIGWLKTLMFDSVFDVARLKSSVGKALADIPDEKRDGRSMSEEIAVAIHTRRDTIVAAKRTLVRAVYLRRLKSWLEREPDTVVGWFEEVRRRLFDANNMRVLVVADVSKVPNPVAAWDTLASVIPGRDSEATDPNPVTNPLSVLSEEGRNPGGYGAVVVPMATLKGTYSLSTAAGLDSRHDPRLPAYMVALNYLDTMEGPLWKAVRGNGLAYGVEFDSDAGSGLMQLRVFRSPNAAKAIEASRAAVQALADGSEPIDRHLVEAAVSAVVVGVANEQSTMLSAATYNYVRGVVRGLDAGWTERLLERVRAVTEDEMRAILTELVLPVFAPGKSNVVVTCAPSLQEEMTRALVARGYRTQTQPLSHFYDDYGLECDGAENGTDGNVSMASGSDESLDGSDDDETED